MKSARKSLGLSKSSGGDILFSYRKLEKSSTVYKGPFIL
jgi:hypothetical protein